MLKVIVKGTVALLVLCLIGAGLAGPTMAQPPLSGQMRQFSFYDTPLPAPETTFRDHAGVERSLRDFHGKVLLVNLWATWCAPCVKEMPALDRLQAMRGGDDFQVIAISTDRGGITVVQPFMQRLGLGHLGIYLDPASTMPRSLGARGLPTTFLIDRFGRVIGSYLGPADWDGPDALALIDHYRLPTDPTLRTSAPGLPGEAGPPR